MSLPFLVFVDKEETNIAMAEGAQKYFRFI